MALWEFLPMQIEEKSACNAPLGMAVYPKSEMKISCRNQATADINTALHDLLGIYIKAKKWSLPLNVLPGIAVYCKCNSENLNGLSWIAEWLNHSYIWWFHSTQHRSHIIVNRQDFKCNIRMFQFWFLDQPLAYSSQNQHTRFWLSGRYLHFACTFTQILLYVCVMWINTSLEMPPIFCMIWLHVKCLWCFFSEWNRM